MDYQFDVHFIWGKLMKNKYTISSGFAIGTLLLSSAAFNPAYAQTVSEATAQNSVEDTNLATVKQIYADFATGNIPGFVAALSEDVVWNEAENNSLAVGNPYIGPDAVMSGVMGPLMKDWSSFSVEPESFMADGNNVAMFGRYLATSAVTGKQINPQVVHHYTLENGKVTRFQQYVDTFALDQAMTVKPDMEESDAAQ